MPPAKTKRAAMPPRRPEQKYGPFHGGVGIAIWLNEVQTESGPRFFRSLTIAPRRYIDPKTGKWEDANSFNVTDLPALILGLEAAHRFMTTTPLPGQQADEELVQMATSDDGNDQIPI